MTVTIPYEFNHECCSYRLPCGICIRTNSMCPLQKNGYSTGYSYTRPVTVTSTGTSSVVNHTAKGKENERDV